VTARWIVVVLFVLAVGCDDPEEALPGSYSGTLDSTVTASRITNMRPDGEGGTVADVTHYSGSSSASGTRVTVRRTGTSHGNTTFEASVGDLCEVPFQLLEGGSISQQLLPARCRCNLDGTWVESHATVSGSFQPSRFELNIHVSYMGSEEHTGGCSHTFVSTASP
jgi:hypothetical protein